MTSLVASEWSSAGGYIPSSSRPASELAKSVSAFHRKTIEHLRSDASAGTSRALNDLFELFMEQAPAERQGRRAVVEVAKQFLLCLPGDIASPELAFDSDGEVLLDWFGSNKRMLSVSLRSDGRLSYAAWFSPYDKEHGTKQFDGVVPPPVVQLARRALF